MNAQKDENDKFLISLSDVFRLFRQNKRKIIYSALAMAMLGGGYSLSKPIKYRAEGTFKEKTNKSGHMGGALVQLLGSDISATGLDHEAASLLKSRKLLKEVIQRLNLQAILTHQSNEEGLLTRWRRNMRIEWHSFNKSPFPVLKDIADPIKVETVDYEGETPLFFDVLLEKNGAYSVYDYSKNLKGKGQFNVPFKCENCSFLLKQTVDDQQLPEKISLTIYPVADLALMLSKDLEIENMKTDKTTLKFFYEHRNRHFASQFINTLMDSYQDHLKKNHDRLATIQLGYLRSKEEEAAKKLANLMQKHADFLSNDLSTVGFADSRKEMEFLSESEHKFKEKLMSSDLELRRLKNIQPGNYAYHDHFEGQAGNTEIINNILREIRELKQEQYSLEMALRNPIIQDEAQSAQSFAQQLEEVERLNRYNIDLQVLIDKNKNGLAPDENSALINDPRFLIKNWLDKLQRLSGEDQTEQDKAREHFAFYLKNLQRLFTVHVEILQGRLTNYQNPSNEYQGINFDIATQLYKDYSRRLLDIESDIRQKKFLTSQLEDPNFEISSLSGGLTDVIGLEMIKRGMELALKLKDLNNQSGKEQERLKSELELQRTFLIMHLQQITRFCELNKQLMNEKIYALQNVSLELVHQRIALLEKNLHDYVESRQSNFLLQNASIQQHLDDIHLEMASLPRKWVAEQLIEQQVDINQLIVQEIAKMVESKNISHNLEVIQSAPIDISLPPVHPVPPGFRLYVALGAVLGGLLSAGFVLVRSLNQGIQATAQNLRALNQTVCGSLPSFIQSKTAVDSQYLETLRRLIAYFDRPYSLKENSSKSLAIPLLLVEGSGPDYSADLARLLKKKGQASIRLIFNFDQATDSKAGLLQYLQGEVKAPAILTDDNGDYVPAGGETLFSIELLGSRLFQELLEKLKIDYDWIIGVSHQSPTSAEIESLTPLFPCLAVTIHKETINDLAHYTTVDSHNKKVAFILSSDS